MPAGNIGSEREGERVMDKCKFCGLRGLVLSTINADYSCEYCGKWQEAILNSAWLIVGYETTPERTINDIKRELEEEAVNSQL